MKKWRLRRENKMSIRNQTEQEVPQEDIEKAFDKIVTVTSADEWTENILKTLEKAGQVKQEGNLWKVKVRFLPDGHYFVSLASHRSYSPPFVRNIEGVAERIVQRGWLNEDVRIETANMPFDYTYHPNHMAQQSREGEK